MSATMHHSMIMPCAQYLSETRMWEQFFGMRFTGSGIVSNEIGWLSASNTQLLSPRHARTLLQR